MLRKYGWIIGLTLLFVAIMGTLWLLYARDNWKRDDCRAEGGYVVEVHGAFMRGSEWICAPSQVQVWGAP